MQILIENEDGILYFKSLDGRKLAYVREWEASYWPWETAMEMRWRIVIMDHRFYDAAHGQTRAIEDQTPLQATARLAPKQIGKE